MARVKVDIKGLENIKKRAVTKVNRAIKSTGILEDIANLIVIAVRDGDPVQRAKAANKKYKNNLSEEWVKRRSRLAKLNPTHPKYGRNKNNLTFTGQLLDSIKGKLIVSKSQIIVEPTGSHKGYKTPTGRTTKRISNKELAKFVQELRDFLFLTPDEIDQINKLLKKELRKKLSEEFKSK